MIMIQRLRSATLALAAASVVCMAGQALAQGATANQSSAQAFPETHLRAARAAVAAIRATDSYDAILPQAAQALKADLIRQNPNIEALISTTVDEKAIALAGRRADLEREAAMIYSRSFTEAELTSIANFYASDAGKKLLSEGPVVSRELVKAANIWQNGVARDLARDVGAHLNQVLGAQANAPTRGAVAPQPAKQ